MLAAEGLDTVPVQPMVIFPGWTVERPDTFTDPEVIVAGEQSLEAEIRQGEARMEPKDVIAVSLLLEKTARTPRLPLAAEDKARAAAQRTVVSPSTPTCAPNCARSSAAASPNPTWPVCWSPTTKRWPRVATGCCG